jgi:glycosyltransferase involved in cell wall biosynthesis
VRLERRRIVFVLNRAVLGGAERRAIPLARGLMERDAVVEVYALTAEDGEERQPCEQLGIPWDLLPVDWAWLTGRARKARELGRLALGLRRARPDALVPFCGFPNVVCGLVWRSTGAELCVWSQQDANELRLAGLPAACDAGVLSSLAEGCSNAVLEYMAAGLVELALDPELRARLGAHNRDRVRREFSIQRMVEQNVELLAVQLKTRAGHPIRSRLP